MSSDPGTDLGPVDAEGLEVGIAVAAYNREITEGLLAGAQTVLEDADVTVVWVNGAFELPVVAQALIERGCDAVVALGAVVAGETDHYRHISRESIRGLQDVMLKTGVPVGLGGDWCWCINRTATRVHGICSMISLQSYRARTHCC